MINPEELNDIITQLSTLIPAEDDDGTAAVLLNDIKKAIVETHEEHTTLQKATEKLEGDIKALQANNLRLLTGQVVATDNQQAPGLKPPNAAPTPLDFDITALIDAY